MKALNEWMSCVEECTTEELQAAIPHFIYCYRTCAIDGAMRIREQTQLGLLRLMEKMMRVPSTSRKQQLQFIRPYLEHLLPWWWCTSAPSLQSHSSNNDFSPQKLARESFDLVFPTAKARSKIFDASAKPIVEFLVRELISNAHVEVSGSTKKKKTEQQPGTKKTELTSDSEYHLSLIFNGLNAWIAAAESTDSKKDEWLQLLNTTMCEPTWFWKLISSRHVIVRYHMFQFLLHLTSAFPTLVSSTSSIKMPHGLLLQSCVSERHAANHVVMWPCLIHICPWIEHLSSQQLSQQWFPKLLSFLRNNMDQSSTLSYPHLLPLIALVTKYGTQHLDYAELLSAMWKGLLRNQTSHTELGVQTILECFHYILFRVIFNDSAERGLQEESVLTLLAQIQQTFVLEPTSRATAVSFWKKFIQMFISQGCVRYHQEAKLVLLWKGLLSLVVEQDKASVLSLEAVEGFYHAYFQCKMINMMKILDEMLDAWHQTILERVGTTKPWLVHLFVKHHLVMVSSMEGFQRDIVNPWMSTFIETCINPEESATGSEMLEQIGQLFASCLIFSTVPERNGLWNILWTEIMKKVDSVGQRSQCQILHHVFQSIWLPLVQNDDGGKTMLLSHIQSTSWTSVFQEKVIPEVRTLLFSTEEDSVAENETTHESTPLLFSDCLSVVQPHVIASNMNLILEKWMNDDQNQSKMMLENNNLPPGSLWETLCIWICQLDHKIAREQEWMWWSWKLGSFSNTHSPWSERIQEPLGEGGLWTRDEIDEVCRRMNASLVATFPSSSESTSSGLAWATRVNSFFSIFQQGEQREAVIQRVSECCIAEMSQAEVVPANVWIERLTGMNQVFLHFSGDNDDEISSNLTNVWWNFMLMDITLVVIVHHREITNRTRGSLMDFFQSKCILQHCWMRYSSNTSQDPVHDIMKWILAQWITPFETADDPSSSWTRRILSFLSMGNRMMMEKEHHMDISVLLQWMMQLIYEWTSPVENPEQTFVHAKANENQRMVQYGLEWKLRIFDSTMSHSMIETHLWCQSPIFFKFWTQHASPQELERSCFEQCQRFPELALQLMNQLIPTVNDEEPEYWSRRLAQWSGSLSFQMFESKHLHSDSTAIGISVLTYLSEFLCHCIPRWTSCCNEDMPKEGKRLLRHWLTSVVERLLLGNDESDCRGCFQWYAAICQLYSALSSSGMDLTTILSLAEQHQLLECVVSCILNSFTHNNNNNNNMSDDDILTRVQSQVAQTSLRSTFTHHGASFVDPSHCFHTAVAVSSDVAEDPNLVQEQLVTEASWWKVKKSSILYAAFLPNGHMSMSVEQLEWLYQFVKLRQDEWMRNEERQEENSMSSNEEDESEMYNEVAEQTKEVDLAKRVLPNGLRKTFQKVLLALENLTTEHEHVLEMAFLTLWNLILDFVEHARMSKAEVNALGTYFEVRSWFHPIFHFFLPFMMQDNVKTSEIYPFMHETLQRSIAVFPIQCRKWWTDAGYLRQHQTRIKSYIETSISPAIVQSEFQLIKEHDTPVEGQASQESQEGQLLIQTSQVARQIITTYQKEDSVLEMRIQLPASYPLLPVQVEGAGRQIGIAENRWRRWMLQILQVLNSQDGHLIDAIQLWKRNIDQEFDGIEPCPICYSIFHPKTLKVPKLTCSTCKNKYHNSCLYKWFNSSGKSKCPICQQPFL